MTFSIVAIDNERKEVGFAIASCFWNAGQVGFAKAGAGAIVSQAQGNWEFIPAFYQKLDQSLDLKEILEHFRSMDDNIENRQVGMVAFRGGSLAFTGTNVSSSFQRTGTDYSCQGNILVGREVITWQKPSRRAKGPWQTDSMQHSRPATMRAAICAGR